jgi:hypothetical protein
MKRGGPIYLLPPEPPRVRRQPLPVSFSGRSVWQSSGLENEQADAHIWANDASR